MKRKSLQKPLHSPRCIYNSRTDEFCEVASYLTTWTYDKMTSQNRSFTLVYI